VQLKRDADEQIALGLDAQFCEVTSARQRGDVSVGRERRQLGDLAPSSGQQCIAKPARDLVHRSHVAVNEKAVVGVGEVGNNEVAADPH
jgi:hypothetical protein